jgi:geranylgeranyl pyrophosphate synthase
MTVSMKDFRDAGSRVVPFRAASERSKTRVRQDFADGSPEFSWEWAARNAHCVDERIAGRVAGEGLLDESSRRYLSSSDKLLHGRLSLAICRTYGLELDSALSVAVACEFLCAASRIRDDLRSWDLVRRSREPGWRCVNENVAVNLGDYFTALAYDALAAVPCEAALRSELVKTFSRASAVIVGARMYEAEVNVTRGQLQLMENYEKSARDIAGTLLALPVECALLLADAPKAQMRRTREALRAYGLICQILSDLSELLQNEPGGCSRPGLRSARLTAPVIWYLEEASASECEQLLRYLGSAALSPEEDRAWRERVRSSAAVQQCYRHAAWIRRNTAVYLKQLPTGLQGCLELALHESVRQLSDQDQA